MAINGLDIAIVLFVLYFYKLGRSFCLTKKKGE